MAEDPGRARPPDAETVRAALLHFANLIRRLEEEGAVLRAIPLLLKRLGDLRQVLFDYEVRVTERLLPIEDPVERESRRVVRDFGQSHQADVSQLLHPGRHLAVHGYPSGERRVAPTYGTIRRFSPMKSSSKSRNLPIVDGPKCPRRAS